MNNRREGKGREGKGRGGEGRRGEGRGGEGRGGEGREGKGRRLWHRKTWLDNRTSSVDHLPITACLFLVVILLSKSGIQPAGERH